MTGRRSATVLAQTMALLGTVSVVALGSQPSGQMARENCGGPQMGASCGSLVPGAGGCGMMVFAWSRRLDEGAAIGERNLDRKLVLLNSWVGDRRTAADVAALAVLVEHHRALLAVAEVARGLVGDLHFAVRFAHGLTVVTTSAPLVEGVRS